MAYDDITTAERDVDSPITVSLIGKMIDNPEHIAAGDTGAPKIQSAALDTGIVTNSKVAANTLTGAKLNLAITSTGNVTVSSVSPWVPSQGYHNIGVASGTPSSIFEIKVDSVWRLGGVVSSTFRADGTNMRITRASGSETLYWQRNR